MADQTKNETGSAFEPTEKIENFLIGFLNFLQQLLCTLRDLAFNQTKFGNTMKSHGAGKEYTKPVTFITLMSFLAIRIFRFGVLTIILAFSAVSCETQTDAKYPSLLDELKVPSVTEIVLYGIPILIVVLLVSQLLKFLLLKGSAESKKAFVSITYYAVGFQYIAYLVALSIISLLFYYKIDVEDYMVLVPLLFLLLWVILVFYRLVSKTIDNEDLRVSIPGLKQIWQFLWSFVLIAITTLSGAGMAYSLAQLEAEELKARPILSLGLIDSNNSKHGEFTVDVLVRNNSDEEIILLSDQVTAYGTGVFQGEIVQNNLGGEHIIILRSNEVGWLTIVFAKPEDGHGSGGFGTRDLIRFAAFSPSGDHKSVSAYVRSDGEVVELSTIE